MWTVKFFSKSQNTLCQVLLRSLVSLNPISSCIRNSHQAPFAPTQRCLFTPWELGVQVQTMIEIIRMPIKCCLWGNGIGSSTHILLNGRMSEIFMRKSKTRFNDTLVKVILNNKLPLTSGMFQPSGHRTEVEPCCFLLSGSDSPCAKAYETLGGREQA